MEASQWRLKRMLYNILGVGILWVRFGLREILDNFTIDDGLPREGWGATKRNTQGRGPITVQLLVSQARQKELDELGSVTTL